MNDEHPPQQTAQDNLCSIRPSFAGGERGEANGGDSADDRGMGESS